MITYNQLSLADILQDCQEKFDDDKPAFLQMLEEHIALDDIIPQSFYNHYYSSTGRSRDYPLSAMLWALILQRIFSVPTDSLLILMIRYSQHLRKFCGFHKVPNATRITRFKQDFIDDLSAFFESLVDLTEPICQAVDSAKADMTIFDSTGIEAYVTENNPKYADSVIRRLKSYAKAQGFDDSYDPYKAAYASMPSCSAANKDVKQLYINGHFCYAYKAGIVTNGLGIVRHIAFYDEAFLEEHKDILVEKKTKSPDEDKSVGDARLLIPTLQDFFKAHPLINPKTFLGDAAFDSSDLYKQLLTGDTFGKHKHFSKAYIPLNKRSGISYPDCPVNESGIPCCPNNPGMPMKSEGSCTRKNGLVRYKFTCPMTKWIRDPDTGKQKRQCNCPNPCTDSPCGRMFYIYPEKNLRAYPGTLRDTNEWNETYKIRTTVERSINHFKESFGLAGRKTQNSKTLKADLFLSGITQLITVLLADNIQKHEYIRSIKPLLKAA